MTLLLDGATVLFTRLIDYAGVFPPASLSLDRAVAEYRRARTGSEAWMLGRFLAPTSMLEDLAAALTATMVVGETPWQVGAVVDEAPGVGALHAQVFHRHMRPAAEIETVEVRLPPAATDGRSGDAATEVVRPVAEAVMSISPDVVAFLEVERTEAWQRGIPAGVEAIATLRRSLLRTIGAKLRTGGTVATAFPTSHEVACFIASCQQHGVPYKATAGLHHPVRHWDGDLGVSRHGFLNLLTAAALAAGGAAMETLVAALDETDPAAFAVSRSGLVFAGDRISIPQLRRMRASLFPAYGSCSFDEPVHDLETLGLIG